MLPILWDIDAEGFSGARLTLKVFSARGWAVGPHQSTLNWWRITGGVVSNWADVRADAEFSASRCVSSKKPSRQQSLGRLSVVQ